jgi:4-amino-4-deoxy-L-arabinose transferase-like glycosyltransferase
MQNKKIVWGLLLAILIAAFALRVTNIKNIPSGIYPDEAQNGIDAQEANATREYKLFYEGNNGREGLFINLQALSIKAFGSTEFALKLWSIIFGTLTVLGVYLLATELFASYAAGLIGAYLTAFSYWAINFSRIGFRAIMVPFLLSFAFYFLFKGLRTKKLHDFIIAGLVYGLGVHTYIAFRVSPLVLVVLFIALIITRKNFLKEYWKHTAVFAVAMMITAAPMLLDFFVWNPQHYASRTSEISVLNPASNQGHLLTTVAKTFGLALQKYFVMGDLNMRHNYPPYALLNPIVGIAFLIGLIYIINKFFHLLWIRMRKSIRDEKMVVYAFLLAWFLALLVPEFLANEGNPHALRSIGTLPVVIIISIIPFLWILKKYNQFGHSYKIFTISVLVGAFVFICLSDPIKYFVFFANSPKQHQVFDANLRNISDYLRTLPQNEQKYIITGSMERLTIKYLNPTLPNASYLYPDQIGQLQTTNNEKITIIFTAWDWETINALRARISNLNLQEHHNQFGDIFITLSN